MQRRLYFMPATDPIWILHHHGFFLQVKTMDADIIDRRQSYPLAGVEIAVQRNTQDPGGNHDQISRSSQAVSLRVLPRP